MPLGRLDWGPWLYGLIGGFIGSGAGAIGAAVGLVMNDKTYLEYPWDMVKIMAWACIFPGVIAAAAYLKQSPLPAPIKTTVETTQVQQNPPAIIKTTVETTEQPK